MSDSITARNIRIQKRKRLFQVWSETGSVSAACKEVGMSRAGFYYWKKRFIEGGFDALAHEKSHAPHNPRRISNEIGNSVIRMRKENPTWGKSRISKKINEQHNAPVVSPNTVRRLLIDAGLWIIDSDDTTLPDLWPY